MTTESKKPAKAKGELELYQPQMPAISADASYDDLVAYGRQVSKWESQVNWAYGDLANTVETRYGEGKLAEFAADIGVEYGSLRRYRDVSRAFPQNARRLAISYSAHMTLAGQPDRAELLDSRDWTLAQARELVSDRVRAEAHAFRQRRRAGRRAWRERIEASDHAARDEAETAEQGDDSVDSASETEQARQEQEEARQEQEEARQEREEARQQRERQRRDQVAAELAEVLALFGDLTVAQLAEFGAGEWLARQLIYELLDAGDRLCEAAVPEDYQGHGRYGRDYSAPSAGELAAFVRGWLDAADREPFVKRWVVRHEENGPSALARELEGGASHEPGMGQGSLRLRPPLPR